MKNNNRFFQKNIKVLSLILLSVFLSGFSISKQDKSFQNDLEDNQAKPVEISSRVSPETGSDIKDEAQQMPVYGNWETFTVKDGLPADKAYCVRIDGDRVLVGTSAGLAVYENETWKTYTAEDGLAHNGVLSIDVSELTGDVWLGTLGGLTRWSAGRFETFTQFNSGLANDVIYTVICDGKDVWVATGGGAGSYDTYTREWGIYTERNAPMHEPWTYGVCAGGGKIFIAAWGGGVIEYTKETKQFRDYVDPDGEMEIDLFPDDGVIHDITTGVTFADDILWVATYFGLSRYDGTRWKGYLDHDSGLVSNFINFLKADGPVVWLCTDLGLSSFNGETWVTYRKNENNKKGKIIITEGENTKEISSTTSISHEFVIGVDTQDDVVWIATSKGVSRGEILKDLTAGL
ncbi:MAG: regulator [Prolixibacteraceae bacterium]|nr:regulator [Prolixibacteraceae bacterium]MBT6999782.1 regulator [Prolixibacteraceae bacterium]MBT7395152.1 regulator [Prolixibacteraceae bacterium]